MTSLLAVDMKLMKSEKHMANYNPVFFCDKPNRFTPVKVIS